MNASRLLAMGLSLAVGIWSAAAAEPPAFVQKPTVTQEGKEWRIAFSVDRETDVAVFIENAEGKAIRHLVAGMLGKNAPEPLKADALEQSVVWDGKDDAGTPASGGPFRARVALSLTPAFEKTIGDDPSDLGIVKALATGPGGELFVFHTFGEFHGEDGATAVAVLGRDGTYRRTIVPYPANLPDDRLKGIKRLVREDGSKVPFIYSVETRAHLPGLGDLSLQQPVVTRDGRLVFIGIREKLMYSPRAGEAWVTVIKTDGSVPEGGILHTRFAPVLDKGANLALSPDEQTLYAAGVCVGTGPGGRRGLSAPRKAPCLNAVMCWNWQDKEPRIFAGKTNKPGNLAESASGPSELNQPMDVATDAEGNVYVADYGNHRIAVFKPDGTALAQVSVQSPKRIAVHRKTGEIYLISSDGQKKSELLKYNGYRNGRIVARQQMPIGKSFWADVPSDELMALDDSADPPVIWLSMNTTNCSFNLQRLEDLGERFGNMQDLGVAWSKLDAPRSIAAGLDMSLDRVNGWLYVGNYWRYRVSDGTWERIPRARKFKSIHTPQGWPSSNPQSTMGGAGQDGHYYMHFGYISPAIARYGPDLKEVPFTSSVARTSVQRDHNKPLEMQESPGLIGGFIPCHGQGITADLHGNVYVLWRKEPERGDFHRATALYVYDSSGKCIREKLVNTNIPGVFSPRVDAAGNVYLAVGLRKGDDWLPAGLRGQIPSAEKDPEADSGINGYPLIYGSIVKFGPEGGAINPDANGVPCNYGHGKRIAVQGAKWIFSEASTVLSWSTPKHQIDPATGSSYRDTKHPDPSVYLMCLCESACLDVDAFGRSFFSDGARRRVGVLDTAGNLIGWFGAYGNADSAGPNSVIPQPAIAFAWPQAVAVGDDRAYISDRMNRRITAVKLEYALSQTQALVPTRQ